MYEILAKEVLNPVTKLYEVRAPAVAQKAQAGQFVIIRISEEGERIPLTIADYDRDRGTITLVVQEVGKTTMEMAKMEPGDSLVTFAGPLGLPSEIENYGTVVVVGGGFAVAPCYPIARALKEAGNTVITIMGARNKELLFWEDRMRSVSDELIVCTDDGSCGRKDLVTSPLKEILQSGRQIDHIWAIGPAVMMKFSALTSQPFGVPTTVNLNSIMVDGTGMCGACRCEVGRETRFACVDGPEFDGHKVDWDLLLTRQRIYVDEEKVAIAHYHDKCQCGNE
ncbi:MAG TPA: sulfide/dihydroorotate dehydrogenase-like FAD/NAD-binding protein [Anaerolineae bacterium]|nr:sulfide/dihydroorotate dehydrogenase-like FAD/NAD-binding protein [Anaerolineae bacterium]